MIHQRFQCTTFVVTLRLNCQLIFKTVREEEGIFLEESMETVLDIQSDKNDNDI